MKSAKKKVKQGNGVYVKTWIGEYFIYKVVRRAFGEGDI